MIAPTETGSRPPRRPAPRARSAQASPRPTAHALDAVRPGSRRAAGFGRPALPTPRQSASAQASGSVAHSPTQSRCCSSRFSRWSVYGSPPLDRAAASVQASNRSRRRRVRSVNPRRLSPAACCSSTSNASTARSPCRARSARASRAHIVVVGRTRPASNLLIAVRSVTTSSARSACSSPAARRSRRTRRPNPPRRCSRSAPTTSPRRGAGSGLVGGVTSRFSMRIGCGSTAPTRARHAGHDDARPAHGPSVG